jgi:hypothetical protein
LCAEVIFSPRTNTELIFFATTMLFSTATLLCEFIRFVCVVSVRLRSAHPKDQRARRVLRRTKKRTKKSFFSLSFSSRRLRASACGRARRVKSGGKIALIDFPPEEKKEKKRFFVFCYLNEKKIENFSNDFFLQTNN